MCGQRVGFGFRFNGEPVAAFRNFFRMVGQMPFAASRLARIAMAQ
jgi:hypothetical protein